MGFFSWKCKVCGHSILVPYRIPEKLSWMNRAVAILKDRDGDIFVSGNYDGYGRINDTDLVDFRVGEPAMFHRRCWEAVGKPTTFDCASHSADDQGFFYDDADHAMTDEEWREKVEEYKKKAQSVGKI